MKYAINIPHFGDCADPRLLADFARVAEQAGWDGFFIWDHIALDWPDAVADVTVALTAIALVTERIRLGAMVTPLARRRPVKFAREIASLDQLSGGRVIVGVGLGSFDAEFKNLGDEADPKVRGVMLDEALEILIGLWGGSQTDINDRFTYEGKHYTIRDTLLWPKPVQQPRPPIWVAGMWPNKPPFRRAAKWDGVFPIANSTDMRALTPDELRDIVAYVRQHRRSATPLDVIIGGDTPGEDRAQAVQKVAAYVKAGATWWHENLLPTRFGWNWGPPPWPVEAMRERIRQGPPK